MPVHPASAPRLPDPDWQGLRPVLESPGEVVAEGSQLLRRRSTLRGLWRSKERATSGAGPPAPTRWPRESAAARCPYAQVSSLAICADATAGELRESKGGFVSPRVSACETQTVRRQRPARSPTESRTDGWADDRERIVPGPCRNDRLPRGIGIQVGRQDSFEIAGHQERLLEACPDVRIQSARFGSTGTAPGTASASSRRVSPSGPGEPA